MNTPLLFLVVIMIQAQGFSQPINENFPYRLNRVQMGKAYNYPIGNDVQQSFLVLVFDSNLAIDSAYYVNSDGQKITIHDTLNAIATTVHYAKILINGYDVEISINVKRPGNLMEIRAGSKSAHNCIK